MAEAELAVPTEGSRARRWAARHGAVSLLLRSPECEVPVEAQKGHAQQPEEGAQVLHVRRQAYAARQPSATHDAAAPLPEDALTPHAVVTSRNQEELCAGWLLLSNLEEPWPEYCTGTCHQF